MISEALRNPLALFDVPRTDFSLARLKHYTGTPPGDFQRFVLFTNYVRYVDEFVAFASRALLSLAEASNAVRSFAATLISRAAVA